MAQGQENNNDDVMYTPANMRMMLENVSMGQQDDDVDLDRDLTDEEKARLSEQIITKREKAKAGAGKPDNEGKEDEDEEEDDEEGEEEEEENELSEEDKAKLEELKAKKPEDLTKEEKEFLDKNTTEPTLIELIKGDFEDLAGEKIEGEFENNTEGAKTLATQAATKIAEKMVKEYFTSSPEFAKVYNHIVVEGRGFDTLLQKEVKPSYLSIDLKEISDSNSEEDNNKIVNSQKQLVSSLLEKRGNSPDDIKIMIDSYETSNKLFDKAKEAKAALTKEYTESVEASLKAEQDAIEAEKAEIVETWNKVKKIVSTNAFTNGMKLPVEDLKGFQDALFNRNAQGVSLLDVKRSKLTLEDKILLDYFIYKDLKVKGLESKKGKTNLSFSKASQDNKNRKSGNIVNGANNNKESIQLKDIDFSKLMKTAN